MTGLKDRIDRTQLVAVAAWTLLALAVLALGAPLATFSQLGPGPGFFLKALAVILLVLAVFQGIALVQHARRHTKAVPVPAEMAPAATSTSLSTRSVLMFAAMAATLFGFAWALPQIGFLLATTLLCWITLILLGRSPVRAFIEASVAAIIVRYAFTAGLGVPLPQAQIDLLRVLGL